MCYNKQTNVHVSIHITGDRKPCPPGQQSQTGDFEPGCSGNYNKMHMFNTIQIGIDPGGSYQKQLINGDAYKAKLFLCII